MSRATVFGLLDVPIAHGPIHVECEGQCASEDPMHIRYPSPRPALKGKRGTVVETAPRRHRPYQLGGVWGARGSCVVGYTAKLAVPRVQVTYGDRSHAPESR